MQKGQYYTIFKLLQGAVFAMVFLAILWGVIQAFSNLPRSTVMDIAPEVLRNAYSAQPTKEPFTRVARLSKGILTETYLREAAKIPKEVKIEIYCMDYFCNPKCEYNFSGSGNSPCEQVSIDGEGDVTICSCCTSTTCGVFISSEEEFNCANYLR